MTANRGDEELFLLEARLERQYTESERLLQTLRAQVATGAACDDKCLPEASKRAVRRLCGFWDRYDRTAEPTASVRVQVTANEYKNKIQVTHGWLSMCDHCCNESDGPAAGLCCCTRMDSCAMTSSPLSSPGGSGHLPSGSWWSLWTPRSCRRKSKARCTFASASHSISRALSAANALLCLSTMWLSSNCMKTTLVKVFICSEGGRVADTGS